MVGTLLCALGAPGTTATAGAAAAARVLPGVQALRRR